MKFASQKVTKDDKVFLQLEKPEMTFTCSGWELFKNSKFPFFNFHFSYFNRGKINLSHLGSMTNRFFNYNFKIIVSAIRAAFSESLVKIFIERINEVLEKIPYDEMFLWNHEKLH